MLVNPTAPSKVLANLDKIYTLKKSCSCGSEGSTAHAAVAPSLSTRMDSRFTSPCLISYRRHSYCRQNRAKGEVDRRYVTSVETNVKRNVLYDVMAQPLPDCLEHSAIAVHADRGLSADDMPRTTMSPLSQ